MDNTQDISLKEFFIMAFYNRKFFFIIFFVGFCIASLYIYSTENIYISKATVFVDPRQISIIEDITSDNSHNKNLLENSISSQVNMMSSNTVIKNVLKDSKLYDLEKMSSQDLEDLIHKTQKNLDIKQIEKTYLIEIVYQDNDPKIAADIANLFAQSFVDEQLSTNILTSENSKEWLKKQIDVLQQEHDTLSDKIQIFRSKHDITSGENYSTSNEIYLEKFNSTLADIRSDIATTKAKYEYSKILIDNNDINAAIAEAIDNPVINEVRVKYISQKKKLYEMTKKLSNSHAVVQQLKRDIGEYESLIFLEMKRIMQTQKSAYEIALEQEKSIEMSISNLLNKNTQTSSLQGKLDMMEQKSKTLKETLNSLIKKYQEIIQRTSLSVPISRITSEAVPSYNKIHPKIELIYMITTVLNLFIFFITVLIRSKSTKEMMENKGVINKSINKIFQNSKDNLVV